MAGRSRALSYLIRCLEDLDVVAGKRNDACDIILLRCPKRSTDVVAHRMVCVAHVVDTVTRFTGGNSPNNKSITFQPLHLQEPPAPPEPAAPVP